jgi:FkbM family methyltransferase
MYVGIREIINQYKLKIRGIIHVGGCRGEELFSYYRSNIKDIILIEANPDLIKGLKFKKFIYKHLLKTNIYIENCAAFDVDNRDIELNITNNLQSSSVLNLLVHSKIYPQIKVIKKITIKTKTINKLFEKNFDIQKFNFLNLDIQGAELKALQGSSKILSNIDAIYTEVNFAELYKGCPHVDEIDYFLKNYNFKRVLTKTPSHPTWGDALYIKHK